MNSNGIVDNGTELFGTSSIIHDTGVTAENGYDALAQYDRPELGGDNDGLITNNDAVWSALNIWIDTNSDSISVPEEIRSLDEFKITKIDLKYKTKERQGDEHGNLMPYWSWITTEKRPGKHRKMQMVDVYLRVVLND